jgi:hypothetical protein
LLHACLEESLGAAPHKPERSGGDLTMQPTAIRLTRARRSNLQPAGPIRQLSNASSRWIGLASTRAKLSKR